MSYQITFTRKFEKNYKKLNAAEKNQLKSKLKLFEENPLHPSLRAKRIQGTEELYEFSVNMDIRVIWCYEGNTIVLMLDIGHHAILDKY